jgi:hypothetical protein
MKMTPRHADDDTDPEGPSRSGSFRIHSAPMASEEGAVSSQSMGAYRLVLFIGSILLGAGAVVTAFAALATVQAEKVVAPVEKKMDAHLDGLKGERKIMEAYVEHNAAVIAEIRSDAAETKKMIRALCRASARPAVCLGGE